MEIRETMQFSAWLAALRDQQARARILVRILRLAHGNAGDVKPVGNGISELRQTYGPGYRVYYVQRGEALIVLLAGGDRSTQEKDIAIARELVKQLSEQDHEEY